MSRNIDQSNKNFDGTEVANWVLKGTKNISNQ